MRFVLAAWLCACGESSPVAAPGHVEIPPAPTIETSSPPLTDHSGAEPGLRSAPDPVVEERRAEVSAFLKELQVAVGRNDAERVASLSSFPLLVGELGGEVRVLVNRDEFVARYREIMPDCARHVVVVATVDDVVFRDMFGLRSGIVWFSHADGGPLRLRTINNASSGSCSSR
jgi:hypothetical protein